MGMSPCYYPSTVAVPLTIVDFTTATLSVHHDMGPNQRGLMHGACQRTIDEFHDVDDLW